MKGLYINPKSRRRVNVRYRDFISLNALDRLIIKEKVKNITFLVEYLQRAMIANSRNRFIPKVREILFVSIFKEYIGYIKQIIAYIPELPNEIEQEEHMNFERMEAHTDFHGAKDFAFNLLINAF